MNHLLEAKLLKEEFPEETKGYSISEIKTIWEEYSDMFAAGWLNPDKESVESAFSIKQEQNV